MKEQTIIVSKLAFMKHGSIFVACTTGTECRDLAKRGAFFRAVPSVMDLAAVDSCIYEGPCSAKIS